MRSAAPWQAWRRQQRTYGSSGSGDRQVIIQSSDLRFHHFRSKAGLLFIFLVDASGSMAVNRMAQAKGALAQLLHQAYIYRDQVALVRFSGEGAETLLPPTRSVERAKRLVDGLPAGGATPLAAGLLEALGVARAARLRRCPQPILVILTDGRANCPANPQFGTTVRSTAIRHELQRVGLQMQQEDLTSVVVDTRPSFLAGDEGMALADWIIFTIIGFVVGPMVLPAQN